MEFRSVNVLGYRVLIQVLPVIKTIEIRRISRSLAVFTPEQAENRAYHEVFDSKD